MAISVGGFEPLTTIDYPDHLACVVFTQGCGWRCRYCHNHDLIPVETGAQFKWRDILEFIKLRQGLLDAVVFSGGEPCLQSDLYDAILQVKALGFKVGLHTGGAYPKRFEQCLDQVDWVGFDIKHLPLEYEKITQTPKSGDKAWASLEILLASGVDYQLRVTRHPGLISDQQLLQLKKLITESCQSDLVVQTCDLNDCLDVALNIV